MAIDFTLSLEQRALQDSARAFAEAVLAPIAAQLDVIVDPAEAFYSTRAAYREMAKAGFTKSFIPVADERSQHPFEQDQESSCSKGC